MVKGIDLFAEHFKGFEDSYVLIGGSACDLWMQSRGLRFRATKDLDIVIVVEALNSGFVKKFWDFVRLAGYTVAQKSTGEKVFYRFHKPANKEYPFMLELFAKSPFSLGAKDDVTITPIPAGDEASSLSAILMDEGYYSFVMGMRVRENELALPIIPAAGCIPLKAKAWIDLTNRKNHGENVDEKDIRKHRNDVFRLMGTLTEDTRIQLPENVAADMGDFISRMHNIPEDEWKNIRESIGIKLFDGTSALERLCAVYNCHQ
jgi:hypothetical protein